MFEQLRLLNKLWWLLRGVGPRDYRARCLHCNTTGQAHYTLRSLVRCLRFQRMTPDGAHR